MSGNVREYRMTFYTRPTAPGMGDISDTTPPDIEWDSIRGGDIIYITGAHRMGLYMRALWGA
jgi:hypothetical protein